MPTSARSASYMPTNFVSLPDDGARWQRLCELDVIAQTRILSGLPSVVRAWERGQQLAIHGWIYDLRDGLLRDLEVSVDGTPAP